MAPKRTCAKRATGSQLAKKFFQHAQKQEFRLPLKVSAFLNHTQLLGFTVHNLQLSSGKPCYKVLSMLKVCRGLREDQAS